MYRMFKQVLQWNQVLSEIFCTHTHTLRLVSPWGNPGTYPIAQHPPYPSGGCPTARGLPHSPSSVPNLQEQHTHGTQHTQWIQEKAQGAIQATTLQDGFSLPTQKVPVSKGYSEANTEKSLAERQSICRGVTSEEGWDTGRPCIRWNLIN